MARNKSKSKPKRRDRETGGASKTSSNPFSSAPPAPEPEPEESVESLILTATELLRIDCSPSAALSAVSRALELSPTSLPAIELAGEINVELGDIPAARSCFEKAVSLDPQGLHEDAGGSGPEKFLWLAQLCEEGGKEAVGWFERGVKVLRDWISNVGGIGSSKGVEFLEERGLKGKLCSALCGMAEIYMTDLCMEPDAEANCERFVTEALLAVPDSAEALQTLASVRISQTRISEAQSALEQSVGLWKNLEPGSLNIPPYATRMATTRLLMETELYDLAYEVLEGLQEEDDQVVDLWYLGGWCLYCKGEKQREEEQQKEQHTSSGNGKGKEKEVKMNDDNDDNDEEDDWQTLWAAAREWLNNCARLYQVLEWEDERLKDHAIEILGKITDVLGEEMDDEEEDEDEDEDDGEGEWEDAESDRDQEMKDS